jgi:hypothetical protein
MFKSTRRAKKKKNATPLDRLRTQVKKIVGGVTGSGPQKGKAKTRGKAKNASRGPRRGARSTTRRAKSTAR